MLKKMGVLGVLALLGLVFSASVWAGNGSGAGAGTGTCAGSDTSVSSGTGDTSSEDSVDEDSDQPDYAGTQGNEDKPGSGNEEPGIAMGDLYGDLYIIVRDENGAPILYEWVWVDGVPVSYFQSDTGYVQPIAIAGSLPQFNDLVPLDVEGEIPEAYAEYTQEVDFGRLNAARAPQDFLDRAYAEAIANINAAASVTLDSAGRLLLINGDEEKAIDAPRENLALYQKLMMTGHLAGITRTDLGTLAHLLPVDLTVAEIPDASDLQQAAAFLAAAADKTGEINIDMVVYLNSVLGINGSSGADYFDFNGFAYQRQYRRGQPEEDVLMGPYQYEPAGIHGEIRGQVLEQICFVVSRINIMEEVFANADASAENVRGFAKASDDDLKVISYIHNWALPEYDE